MLKYKVYSQETDELLGDVHVSSGEIFPEIACVKIRGGMCWLSYLHRTPEQVLDTVFGEDEWWIRPYTSMQEVASWFDWTNTYIEVGKYSDNDYKEMLSYYLRLRNSTGKKTVDAAEKEIIRLRTFDAAFSDEKDELMGLYKIWSDVKGKTSYRDYSTSSYTVVPPAFRYGIFGAISAYFRLEKKVSELEEYKRGVQKLFGPLMSLKQIADQKLGTEHERDFYYHELQKALRELEKLGISI